MGAANPAAAAGQDPALELELCASGVIQLTLVNQRTCLLNEASCGTGGVGTPGCELRWQQPLCPSVSCWAGGSRVWPCSIAPEQLLPRVSAGALRAGRWSRPHAAAGRCPGVCPGWGAAGARSAA